MRRWLGGATIPGFLPFSVDGIEPDARDARCFLHKFGRELYAIARHHGACG